MKENVTALIDVGSNSVRLMWGKSGRLYQKFTDITQLAEGLDASGILKPIPMRRTAEAIARFAKRARNEGALIVRAFATEAVRAATNRDSFCALVKEIAEIELEVIDGDTEALCGFTGAVGDADEVVGVIDIGGASVEVTVGVRGKILYSKSLPIGVVRLKERATTEAIDYTALISEYRTAPPFTKLVAIGGTATTAAALSLDLIEYDPEKVDGLHIPLKQLVETTARCAALSVDELLDTYPTLVRKRAEVLGFGLKLLTAAAAYFQTDGILVSERDNLEGFMTLHI